MEVSNSGILLIKKWEGYFKDAYPDPASLDGKPITCGYGSTRKLDGNSFVIGDKLSEIEASELLRIQIKDYEEFVDDNVTSKLTQNQRDAVISFVYNVKRKSFLNSTLLKKINNNPWDLDIAAEFIKFKNASGKPFRGLLLRRLDEARMYFTK